MPSPSKTGSWRKNWRLRYFRYRLLARLLLLRLGLRRKILVVCRSAGMGDVIATLPACRQLILDHPDRQLVYVTHPGFVPILEMAGLPITVVPDPHATLPGFSGIFFPSHRFTCADDFLREPTVNFIQDFALSCGATIPPDATPRLHPPDDLRKSIEAQARELAAGRPLVAFHMGPTDRVREWPHEKWVELAALLVERGACVIQLGVNFHTRWGKHEAAAIPGIRSFLDQLSLAETACWIAQSDVFVGIDSGLLQMAAALDRTVVAITGPTDMKFRFSPETRATSVRAEGLDCLGCHHRSPRLHWNTDCPFHIACMQSVGSGEVFRAICAASPLLSD